MSAFTRSIRRKKKEKYLAFYLRLKRTHAVFEIYLDDILRKKLYKEWVDAKSKHKKQPNTYLVSQTYWAYRAMCYKCTEPRLSSRDFPVDFGKDNGNAINPGVPALHTKSGKYLVSARQIQHAKWYTTE